MSDAPAKYRKLPVVVEAMQWSGTYGDYLDLVLWASGVLSWHGTGSPMTVEVKTREGSSLDLVPGAWLIKGVEGEFYPCADSVFRKTYEPLGAAVVSPDVPEVYMSDAPTPAKYRYKHSRIVKAAQVGGRIDLRAWLGDRFEADRPGSVNTSGHNWCAIRSGQWVVEFANGELDVLASDEFYDRYALIEDDEPDSLEATAADILAAQPEAVQLVIRTLCAGTRMEIQEAERLRREMRAAVEALERIRLGQCGGVESFFGELRRIIARMIEQADKRE